MANSPQSPRLLAIVLGDQLDHQAAIFEHLDANTDTIWMAENEGEATHVWCHKLRLAFFFSAMRHFRDWLHDEGYTVRYHALETDRRHDSGKTFEDILRADLKRLKPERVIVTQPGDHRVQHMLEAATDAVGIPLEILRDTHFYMSIDDFRGWASGRKTLTLETYYRKMRKDHNILMEANGKDPVGGEWNFDKDNRETFGKNGPGKTTAIPEITPDAATAEVIDLVRERYPDHPGSLDHFDLPVTRADALRWLDAFICERLPAFGTHQDAMWTDSPFLNHARLSCLLNVKLLNPREVVSRAVEAYEAGKAPINSVEGFVRQILGWREFVRGVYWNEMPEYEHLNALDAKEEVPPFFWDGKTEMRCVADSMKSVLNHGYAHHIQRLMVLGLFAQIYGVHPRKFHEWHMAMYLDAIDWASMPNTIGMSQFGDGGIVGTKPYCASGNYINKMSNYCKGCRYKHNQATGDDACPFTTLYYDFLARHHDAFRNNRRMTFQVKNLERKTAGEIGDIRKRANAMRSDPAAI